MSEFTSAITSMTPENNFMQCTNDTKMHLSHADFKKINWWVWIVKNKCVFHKSKRFCPAFSCSSLCSHKDHLPKIFDFFHQILF